METPSPLPDIAHQAQTEYLYAIGTEGGDYGEEPREASVQDAEKFLDSFKTLNPLWSALDFHAIDFEYLHNLSDEGERIEYAIDALTRSVRPKSETKEWLENARDFIRKYKSTIAGVTAILGALAVISGVGIRDEREGLDNSSPTKRMALTLNEQRLILTAPNALSNVEKDKLVNWLSHHPGVTLKVIEIRADIDEEAHGIQAHLKLRATKQGRSVDLSGYGHIDLGDDFLSRANGVLGGEDRERTFEAETRLQALAQALDLYQDPMIANEAEDERELTFYREWLRTDPTRREYIPPETLQRMQQLYGEKQKL